MLAPGQPIWQPVPPPDFGLVPAEVVPRWDISVNALWLERDFGRSVLLGSTNYSPFPMQTNQLWSDDVPFPLEPGVRLQFIGRITDQMAIEVTSWGLQQWSVGRTIYADPTAPTLANSIWLNSSPFDNFLSYNYNSEVANVEINQRFKLLSFDPYRTFSWLWGVRYFNLSDDFSLTGADLGSGTVENLDWRTSNNLIGLQAGLHWAWGWDRFQLGTEAKVGLFANVYNQHSTDTATAAPAFRPSDTSHNSTDLAAMLELSIVARYRVTKCLWLRAGYQYYCVGGLALGPRQLGGFDDGGTVQLDGLSVGVELMR